jgi:formate transporter
VKTLMVGIVFPPAIWMITFLGGALFTSHVVATIPVIKGVVRRSNYFKALGAVYLGNLSGTGFIVLLIGLTGALNATGDNTILGNMLHFGDGKLYDVRQSYGTERGITAGDVFLTIMYVFFSGILCNLCVSATLPITFTTRSRGTASAVMFFAVFYFAVAGYQHSPANTFFF